MQDPIRRFRRRLHLPPRRHLRLPRYPLEDQPSRLILPRSLHNQRKSGGSVPARHDRLLQFAAN
ncbi:hypothetical protein LINGRAPRIM_LOCUS2047 [Linum grandiflorum]